MSYSSYSEKEQLQEHGAKEVDSNTTVLRTGLVWVDISRAAGVKDTFSDVSVQTGDYLSSIKRKLWDNCCFVFPNIDAPLIKLYESAESTEPLDDRTRWNASVPWGTEKNPLIAGSIGMIYRLEMISY
jgi:hypothetical protein